LVPPVVLLPPAAAGVEFDPDEPLPQAVAPSATTATTAAIANVRMFAWYLMWCLTRTSTDRIYDHVMQQQHPVWLFDFDGTLVDSEQLILASFRHATDVVLGATPPDDELRAGIGLTLEAQARHLAGDRAEQLFEVYVEHNRAAHRELLRTFAGVPEMIGRLRARGARLGVVTAKIRPTMELGFEHVPLEPGWFDVLIAKEDTERHKPEPEPLLLALERLAAAPADAIYVGDSPFDIRAAHAAGVTAAAAAWGDIFPRDVLVAERPQIVFDSPDQVAP
jgi:pyrophosphatase PpaX